ncbi:FtsW/RodA/SpoVE family cell cycle protein [Paenibacillus sp. J23TS9]|uniref:FtsW/RodA/SpoVE family cell cycle protein n=1 Tax=Paenibacillus sp. J23TS9 TaxID=2807193 RepID=UPI001BCB32E9|nr:FtsW/RodA/SpoVE family cell cycle protein [Paenibacillus sp. J23TS9]
MMIQPEQHAMVTAFLDNVCKHVRAKELHAEIREELSSHIAERMEILLEQGMSEEAAAAGAVGQMGEPVMIGRNLHQAHKPRMEWTLFAIVGLLGFIGIFGAFTVQQSGLVPHFRDVLLEKKVVYTLIGLVFLMLFYIFDYRKLKKCSNGIFFGTLMVMVLTPAVASTINGSKAFLSLGAWSVNMMFVSMLLLLLALAGMKPAKEWRGAEHLVQLVCRGVLPVILFSQASSLFYGLIYLTGFFLITWRTKKHKGQFALLSLPLVSIFIFTLARQAGQLYHRLKAFLYPVGDDGYQLIQTKAAIHAAGWFGQGFAAPNETLPFVYSDSLFPYLIYCFGWSFGMLVVVLNLLLMIRFWKMKDRLHDDYAKRLLIGLMTIFGIRLIWPVLMAFGVVPIIGEGLPFVGYSGTAQVFDYAAVGLLLSIYRRKNMISRETEGIVQGH